MKKYIIPEIRISNFKTENIFTMSGNTHQTAIEQANTAASNIKDSQKTFSLIF